MLYLYYGDDLYALEKHLATFRERYLSRYTSGLNMWKIDLSAELPLLREALASRAMFEERRLVFAAGALSLGLSQWEELATFLDEYDVAGRDDIVVVLYEKGIPKERAARVAFAKKKGTVREFARPKGAVLLRWLEGELRARKGSAERGALEELVE